MSAPNCTTAPESAVSEKAARGCTPGAAVGRGFRATRLVRRSRRVARREGEQELDLAGPLARSAQVGDAYPAVAPSVRVEREAPPDRVDPLDLGDLLARDADQHVTGDARLPARSEHQ